MNVELVAILIDLVSIVITYLILKNNRFLRLKLFLFKLFWIDKFQGKGMIRRFLLFGAWFFMIFYLFAFTMMFLSSICFLNLPQLIFTVVGIIIYPLMYRLVMGFQRFFHGI